MKKMKRASALVLAAAMIMSLTACGGGNTTETTAAKEAATTAAAAAETTAPAETAAPEVDPNAEKFGGDLVIANANLSTTMDPMDSSDALGNVQWMAAVWDHAVCNGADGTIYPQICDYELSDDGLELKLTLRERYFSNGDPIEMEDFLASLQRTYDSLSEKNKEKYFGGVTGAVEGNTLTLTFAEYNVNFMEWYANPLASENAIMPKEVCEKYKFDEAGDPLTLFESEAECIGSGPYVLTKWVPDVEIVLTRNEDYEPIVEEGATAMAAPRMAYPDTITFSTNTDAASRTAGMIAGDYDIGSISNEMVETAVSMGIQKIPVGTTWTHGIFFNLDESNADSPVADVNVRKAIRAALDCKAILLAVVGDESRVVLEPSPVIAENVYYNTIVKDTEWNIADKELAKKYLEESSYDGTPIVWLTNGSGSFYKASMAAIPMLEEIGLNIELMAVDGGSHSAMRKDPSTGHDIGCWEVQKARINPITQTTFVNNTSQGWWTSDLRDEALTIMQKAATGSEESINAYKQFSQAVADEVPYILYGNLTGLTYAQSDVVVDMAGHQNYFWNCYFAD